MRISHKSLLLAPLLDSSQLALHWLHSMWRVFAFISIISLMTTFAGDRTIYLGCPDGIYLTIQNAGTGTLQPPKMVGPAKNPSFLAASRDGKTLYSVSETNAGSVIAWKIGAGGVLLRLNEQPTGGADPCHLAISPSGRVLLAANYSGGSVATYLIGKDGSLNPRAAFIQFVGTGPDPKRQIAPHAHGIYVDAAEKWVYATDLGTDKVWIFQFNAETGNLVPNEPAFASLPPGSGPRHLAFGLDRTHAYVNGEMGLGVTSLLANRETGELRPTATVSVFAADSKKATDTAELVVHPNGKFLYLSTRGYSSISLFQIAPEGKLIFVENSPLTIDGPRHFAISPEGRWMILAGQNSNQITVYAIEPKNGKLVPTGHTIAANHPTCVVFAALP